MRLIHSESRQLHDFAPDKIPKYAVLSHTWGDEEVTFADLQRPLSTYEAREGWSKIVLTCQQARRDGLEYAWVDTCCIDKSSSAELSEAINSMFAWYRDASQCYAYLTDMRDVSDLNKVTIALALRSCRWFRRGWTLQELLAPAEVMFYSGSWNLIGSRTELARTIATVTGIETSILKGQKPVSSVCVARRMSWVSHRQTTRPEDLAYCVLGLFDIHIPTLYGEGDKAFLRLQEEILRTSDDHSLFAWIDESASESASSGLLAPSPALFKHCASVVAFRDWTEPSLPFSLSNSGLSISLPLVKVSEPDASGSTHRALLNCAWSADRSERTYIALEQISARTQQYCRRKLWSMLQSSEDQPQQATQIFIRQNPMRPLPQDIIHPTQWAVEVQNEVRNGAQAVEYVVQAYLHTEAAAVTKDGIGGNSWFSSLMRQNAFNSWRGYDPVFSIPGRPQILALVLLMEYLPERQKFFLLIGSGYNSHLPAVGVRTAVKGNEVAESANSALYNDMIKYLKPTSSKFEWGSYVANRNSRDALCTRWFEEFQSVFDPTSSVRGRGFSTFQLGGWEHQVHVECEQEGHAGRTERTMRIRFSQVNENAATEKEPGTLARSVKTI